MHLSTWLGLAEPLKCQYSVKLSVKNDRYFVRDTVAELRGLRMVVPKVKGYDGRYTVCGLLESRGVSFRNY